MVKKILFVALTVTILVTLLMTACTADKAEGDTEVNTVTASVEPELTTENYNVFITEAQRLTYVRFALGSYTTSPQIKNAPDCVTLNPTVIKANTLDGVLIYEMPSGGIYSFWLKLSDGSERIFTSVDMTYMTPSVTTDGVTVTVSDFYGVNDLFIAKGTFTNYQEIKNNGYIARFTSNKLAALKSFSYTVKDEGDYTLLLRFPDRVWYEHFTLDCVNPAFEPNGLQLTVKNLEGVKCIRTAYGEYSTISALKKAQGQRSFTSNVIKGSDEYTIQYRDSGVATVVVQYNNGYYEFYEFNAQQKIPTLMQEENTITFGDLDGLKLIRYAEGEYYTSKDIKFAPGGSKVIKADAVADGCITLTLEPGTYSFCVQYEDESYNFYVVNIRDAVDTPAVFSKEYSYTDANGKEIDTLPYWLYTPANARKGMPLIVVLHSALVKSKNELSVEANLDNMVTAAEELPKFIYDGVFGDIPAYIVMPQTSSASLGWAQRGSEVIGLVEYCKREYGIDADNISVMGYSLGGTGAVELASAYPEVFSRVLSVAGGIDGVTNNIRPYLNGKRMQLSDTLYPDLRVTNDSGVYEKSKMKYLYAADGNKYKATGDAAVQAEEFAEQRIADISASLRSSGAEVWLIVGSKDAEVKPEIAARLCEAIASDNARCEILDGYSHAKAIAHCLTITEEMVAFLVE